MSDSLILPASQDLDSSISRNAGKSAIHVALEEFKVKYSWDKSLITSDTFTASKAAYPGVEGYSEQHSATYLEDFILTQQTTSREQCSEIRFEVG